MFQALKAGENQRSVITIAVPPILEKCFLSEIQIVLSPNRQPLGCRRKCNIFLSIRQETVRSADRLRLRLMQRPERVSPIENRFKYEFTAQG